MLCAATHTFGLWCEISISLKSFVLFLLVLFVSKRTQTHSVLILQKNILSKCKLYLPVYLVTTMNSSTDISDVCAQTDCGAPTHSNIEHNVWTGSLRCLFHLDKSRQKYEHLYNMPLH